MSASPAPTSSCPSPVPPCIQQKHVSPRCHCQRGFCRCTSLLCCERSPGQVSCQSILSTVCLVSGGASVVVVQMLEGGASYLCFSRALFSVCSVSSAPTSSCPSPVPPCIQQKHVSPRCHCQRGFCRCTSLLCCERSPGQVSCQSILSTVCLVSGGASVVVVQMLEGGASYLCFSRALFSVCSVFSRSHVFLSFSSPSLHTAEAFSPRCHCQRGFCRCTSLLCCERSEHSEHSVLGLWRSFRCRCPDVRRRCAYLCFSRALFSVCSVSFSRSHVFLSFSSPSLHTASMSAPDVIVKEASAVAQACCAVNGRQARCRVRAF